MSCEKYKTKIKTQNLIDRNIQKHTTWCEKFCRSRTTHSDIHTVYRKFWSTHEKTSTHIKDLLSFYASSCSCESSFGGRPREMQRFLRSSGNLGTTTMLYGWNRIWNKNSAFHSSTTASCDEAKKINKIQDHLQKELTKKIKE